MDKSKLIQLLKTFQARDHRLFADFLASPYFNKNEELVRFYQHLRKLAPQFPERKIEKQAIWKRLYPKKAFDEKHLYYLMSDLHNLGLEYISVSKYQGDKFYHQFFMLDSTADRGLQKHYQHIQQKILKDQRNNKLRNRHHYYRELLLGSLEGRAFGKARLRTTDDLVHSVSDNLDYFYLISKLRLTCEMVNRANFLSEKYDEEQVDRVLRFTGEANYEHIPYISVFACILKMLVESDNEIHFQQLKRILGERWNEFEIPDLQEIFVYAQNYCIGRVRSGFPNYLNELFALYRQSGEIGLLLDRDGLISPWKYKNIISVGIRLKEFVQTEDFIQNFRKHLPEDYRKDAYHYNIANLAFHKGNFSEALQNLLVVRFSDVFYSLDTKKMLLKIYYNQESTEAFYSLVASFRIFLTRNKLISDRNRLSYKNFIRLVNALYKLKHEGKGSKAEITDSLNHVNALVDEDWIRKEIELAKG